jgi:hypothetical protein
MATDSHIPAVRWVGVAGELLAETRLTFVLHVCKAMSERRKRPVRVLTVAWTAPEE